MYASGLGWSIRFALIVVYIMSVGHARCQEVVEAPIHLESGRITTFQLFQKITSQTGYFFVYDSELISNEKVWNLRRGHYSLNALLQRVVEGLPAGYRFSGNYIIFYPVLSDAELQSAVSISHTDTTLTKDPFFIIAGRILDGSTGQPLPYATIAIQDRGRGISSNSEGVFRLRIPAEFAEDTLKISYMGFAPRFIPLAVLRETTSDIVLSSGFMSLQEIIISGFDPRQIMLRAISRIPLLYSQKPSIHNAFYREGVFRGDHMLNYSEAVFDIFRAAQGGVTADQVKLLKSRNIINAEDRDTISVKLKAGVQNALELDIIKNPVDFVTSELIGEIEFPSSGLLWHNNKLVYEIDFRSNSFAGDNIYEGTIYIDRETLAILQVNFGIIPSYLRRHQNRFFVRRSAQHFTTINQIRYQVSYGQHDGNWHVMHIRCDIDLRIRQRNRLWGTNYNAFFEMATMEIRTDNVQRFPPRDALRTNVVFVDQKLEYDEDFWRGFNFIIPESTITQALRKVRTTMDVSVPEWD